MTVASIAAVVRDVFISAALTLKPPPKVTVTEWAERNIVLSSEDSAEAGTHYRSARAPYQRGMQDAVLLPGVEEVVFMTSAQIGKTLILKNILAYFIKEDPSSILWMVPTLDLAKKVATQRLAPMFRDVIVLRELFDSGSRKHGNSMLERSFPGGVLFMVGANSAASLSSMPIRIVLCDEVSRYPASAGPEGDPISLAAKRQTTFQGFRKRVLASTPTIKFECRIEAAYDATNQCRFHVPCLHCGEYQVLSYTRLRTPPSQEPTIENTRYICEHCQAELTEFDKAEMLRRGEWRARYPERRDRVGFWINELYSPFVNWAEMAKEGRDAYAGRRENPEKYKTFVNLALAETYEEKDEDLDLEGLRRRCENYPPPSVPDAVSVLTAGADVQEDRIEVEVVGWGRKFESWSLDRQVFYDDAKPEGAAEIDVVQVDRKTKWQKLDLFLATKYLHARGVRLPIECTFVDSGYNAGEVYRFTKPRGDRGIYSSKGANSWGAPPLAKPNFKNQMRVKLYLVGVSQVKLQIYRWLKIDTRGPGYMHFSLRHNDADFFAQLTCEQLKRKYEHGYPVRYWEKPEGARNEALDCRVYAYAALLALSPNAEQKIEWYREQLLEQARHLADLRKKGANPDQLDLLQVGDEVMVPADAPDVAYAPEVPAVQPDPKAEVKTAEVNTVKSDFVSSQDKNNFGSQFGKSRSSWLKI